MSVLFCSGYFFYTATRVIFPKIQIWLRLNFLPLFAPLYPRSKIQRTQLGDSPKLQSHWWSPCINSCPPLHPHRTFDFPLGTSRLALLCVLSYFFSLFSLPSQILDFQDSDQQRPLNPQGCLQPLPGRVIFFTLYGPQFLSPYLK